MTELVESLPLPWAHLSDDQLAERVRELHDEQARRYTRRLTAQRTLGVHEPYLDDGEEA
jgi:hypothetical protein